jgi:hypothetical protein
MTEAVAGARSTHRARGAGPRDGCGTAKSPSEAP